MGCKTKLQCSDCLSVEFWPGIPSVYLAVWKAVGTEKYSKKSTYWHVVNQYLATERWGVAAKRTAQWRRSKSQQSNVFLLMKLCISYKPTYIIHSACWTSDHGGLILATTWIIQSRPLSSWMLDAVAGAAVGEIFVLAVKTAKKWLADAPCVAIPWSGHQSFTCQGRVEVVFLQSREVAISHSHVEVESR